ncbi:DUF6458 family protein [Kribbella sp. NPDC051586]|uniref:DUF6458 family protein n=1 Tax=Kribbella sp. NPDC051586 TaxID=3364118 RepID=UPI0037910B46
MSIGAGIFLIVVGAILAFGIKDRSGAVDLSVVGVIIMLAGAAGIWLSYNITRKRQQAVETQAVDPAVEEEYRTIQGNPGVQAPADPQHRTDNSEPDSAVVRNIELDPAASGLRPRLANRRARAANRLRGRR